MKAIIWNICMVLFLISCVSISTSNSKKKLSIPENAVRIANDSLNYEIIILDNGFETYLASIAKPKFYYSQNYLEIKNRFYVDEWNRRAKDPQHYNPSIYENVINYDFDINYGLEVNYLLFNYFKFVTYKYKEKF